FYLTDTLITHIYTLSLHDALPISSQTRCSPRRRQRPPSKWCSPPSSETRKAGHAVMLNRSKTWAVVLLVATFVAGIAVGAGAPRDRKSTRLNFSHEWISYAVFRLK